MEVVGMWSSALDEDKRNVGDCAVVNEILERIGPEEHTQPSEYFEYKAHSQKNSGSQEVQQDTVAGRQSGVVCR